jgi:hypothetical protein
MTRAAFSVLVVLLTVCPLTADRARSAHQKPIAPPPGTPIPDRTSRLKTSQYAVAVKGCIQSGRLKMSAADQSELPFDTLGVSEFILEGPKEMLRQIQEQHKGHYDEIEGIATVPPPPNDSSTSVTTTKKGPVRVTVGSHDEKGPVVLSTPRPIKLRVASLTHLSEGCVARQ